MSISKITHTFDFSDELDLIPQGDRKAALKEIGQYMIEAVLADVGEAKSPVTGMNFKRLSEEYAEKKAEESSNVIPNLELSGDMLDALDFKIVGNKIEFGIWGDEAPKADGHCNHSGDSELPRRTFIPDKDENFRPEIRNTIQEILESYVDEEKALERLEAQR